MSDGVARARQVLEAEREAVLGGLAEERAAAGRAAEEHRRWRADVEALLGRGRSVGLSVADMADALGISRQWTNHLAKRAVNSELERRSSSLQVGLRLGDQPAPQPPPDA